MTIFAHSIPGRCELQWEPLSHHLGQVADRAAAFAEAFEAGALASVMGGLHDIGKVSAAYQNYIRTPADDEAFARGPDHSTAGAVVAVERYGLLGRLMAFGIAGHHSGLMDGVKLTQRQGKSLEDYTGWEQHAPLLPDQMQLASGLPTFGRNAVHPAFSQFFLIRMLFSCLVDADFLETEAFYARARQESLPKRGGRIIAQHRNAVRAFMSEHRKADTPVNILRSEILDHAVNKASMPTGLFTLTVPTGGGKTLTALSFALEHAIAHELDRIITVIPFTSIIEQTAEEYRKALGPDLAGDVLEHHSSFEWDRNAPNGGRDQEAEGASGLAKLRRDAENWDAPLVVTTAVQFFESLFAARTSRARKLHNLARSVIIIDEAQSIPVHLLRPCLAAIDELALNYGVTVILCTATQPALRQQDGALPLPSKKSGAGDADRPQGLDIPCDRELAPDPVALYRKLRRVDVEWRQTPLADTEVAARFARQPQMLCIVNSRAHARALFEAIREQEGARHLTTLMCARHRRDVLKQVRADLAERKPVRLVATSLIEAGVDVSFPEVWRAAAGLSSLAQAAGRCNRHGEMNGLGRAVMFEPAEHKPPAILVPFYQAAREALRLCPDDPLGLEAIHHYYRTLYWQRGYEALDKARIDGEAFAIVPAIANNIDRTTINFPFRTISDAFRLIDDVMEPVLVPYDDEAKVALSALAHAEFPPAGIQRKLQQYVVPVPAKVRAAMVVRGDAAPVRPDYGDRFIVLTNESLYDFGAMGLSLDDHQWRASTENIYF